MGFGCSDEKTSYITGDVVSINSFYARIIFRLCTVGFSLLGYYILSSSFKQNNYYFVYMDNEIIMEMFQNRNTFFFFCNSVPKNILLPTCVSTPACAFFRPSACQAKATSRLLRLSTS
jgi:hypothetical protein